MMLRFARSFLWVALVAVALTAGCGGGGSSLVGTWVLDVKAFEEFDEFKEMPEEQRKMTMAMMAMIEMELTFTSDKMTFHAKIMGQDKSDEMSYEIKSQTGNKMVLESTDKEGKKETVNAEIKGDLLFLSKGGNEKFALRRK